jgi:hypothetical protein
MNEAAAITSNTLGASAAVAPDPGAGTGGGTDTATSKSKSSKADPLTANRDKYLALARGDDPPSEGKGGRSERAGKADGKASTEKAAESKTDTSKADGEGDEGEDKPGDEKAAKRIVAKAKRQANRLLLRAQERDQQSTLREATLSQREKDLEEAVKKDPVKWLNERGISVREYLIEQTRSGNHAEDPRDKLAREANERVAKLEKQLEERGKKDESVEEEEAVEKIRQQVQPALEAEFSKVADSDDYPKLSEYSDRYVGELAWITLKEHYKATGVELAPDEIFARLEYQLKRREAEDSAHRRSNTANAGGSAGPPDRARAGRTANLESANSRATHDVTNRSTRVPSAGVDPKSPEGLRLKYEEMARKGGRR